MSSSEAEKPKAEQIIAFKSIHKLTPIAQVEEVERLATKEPSTLNFALNIYLAQLYNFTYDKIYKNYDKGYNNYDIIKMGSITDELVLQLNFRDDPKTELDRFSLNAAKKVAAAAVIKEALTVSNHPEF